MQIFLTTLNVGTYTFPDLGDFTVTHPVSNLPLVEPNGEFTQIDIQHSLDLVNAVIAGDIQLTNEGGGVLANISDLQSADPGTFVHLTGDENIAGQKSFTTGLDVVGTTNYELGVTDDDDIPNKKYVDDALAAIGGAAPTFIKVSAAAIDLTTNYNVDAPEIGVTLTGTVLSIGQVGNLTNNNGTITCNFTGTVKVIYSMPHTSTGQRAALKTIIQQNTGGGFINVGAGNHSYIRNNNGTTKQGATESDYFQCSTGDQFRIGARRSEGASQASAINLLERSYIIVERIT